MHKNLLKVQESMVECVKQALDIFEITDRKPLVIAALKIGEKPLSISDLKARTKLDDGEISKILARLIEKEMVTESLINNQKHYEMSDEIGKKFISMIHSKIKSIQKIVATQIDESRKLMSDGKKEFNEYDALMARFLGEKLHKAEVIAHIMKRKVFFFDFLESCKEDCDPIKRIKIE